MKEYIERNALIEELNKAPAYFDSGDIRYGIELSIVEIKKVAASDVQEVVHGKWEICSDGYYPYCSVCKEEPSVGVMTKYCPNCGAKMKL